ncbi:stress-responsive transcription factor hsf1 [Dimargaris cristalligena]|uniref:HSF-type DNA-binding-domain-containing protein n=1 Tax=Dimargaris cristalligena TaxID=215637 RepID=A0A4P9ZYR0_9FUNG|nr:stress-responsive transcription factor hsf1 [Dimargaris cristalligena]RKP38895.1 HSF-type DNA-binding-domain-containing protein [Dimargaris cristalligena]|eukprot:RKP38895.1 HSF-type DNA-binding-domain-containing protein [Dimargaris cristalligena]
MNSLDYQSSDSEASLAGSRKTSKCLFPQKLYRILNNPEYNDYLWWNDSGDRFYLDRNRICESGLLLRHFKTGKRESFERQLRGYHFKLMIDNRKSKDKGKNIVDYSHPCFLRSQPALLVNVKNQGNHRKTQMRHQAKAAKAHALATAELAAISAPSSPETNAFTNAYSIIALYTHASRYPQ